MAKKNFPMLVEVTKEMVTNVNVYSPSDCKGARLLRSVIPTGYIRFGINSGNVWTSNNFFSTPTEYFTFALNGKPKDMMKAKAGDLVFIDIKR